MIYDETNITDEYVDCPACNAVCYKLIDCINEAHHVTVSTSNPAFAIYVGKVIKWIDEADAPDFVEHCATVEVYVCRKETLPTPDITVIDCYDTCEECLYVEPEPVEPPIVTGRKVLPGYDVADCVTPSKCDDCE